MCCKTNICESITYRFYKTWSLCVRVLLEQDSEEVWYVYSKGRAITFCYIEDEVVIFPLVI